MTCLTKSCECGCGISVSRRFVQGHNNKALREYYFNPCTGCWHWLLAKDKDGYGVSWRGQKAVAAHIKYYEKYKGPIPDGLILDHTCTHTDCVNPDHLEAVTVAENTRRGKAAKITMAIADAIRNEYGVYPKKRGPRTKDTGPTMLELGKKYSLGSTEIYFIIKGKKWKKDAS